MVVKIFFFFFINISSPKKKKKKVTHPPPPHVKFFLIKPTRKMQNNGKNKCAIPVTIVVVKKRGNFPFSRIVLYK